MALKIDVDEIERIIVKLEDCLENIDSQLKAVEFIGDDINNYWKSTSTGKYCECLDNTHTNLYNQRNKLQKVIDDLNTLIERVVATERKLQNIFSDVGRGSGGGGGGSH